MTAMKAMSGQWKIWAAVSLSFLLCSCLQIEARFSRQDSNNIWEVDYSFPRYLADLTMADSPMPAFYLPTSQEQWQWLQQEYSLTGSFERQEEGESYRISLILRNVPNNQLNRWLPIRIEGSSNRMQISLSPNEEVTVNPSILDSARLGKLSIFIESPGSVVSAENLIEDQPGNFGMSWDLNEIIELQEEQIIVLEWNNG